MISTHWIRTPGLEADGVCDTTDPLRHCGTGLWHWLWLSYTHYTWALNAQHHDAQAPKRYRRTHRECHDSRVTTDIGLRTPTGARATSPSDFVGCALVHLPRP